MTARIETTNSSNVRELSAEELDTVSGGHAGIAVAAIVVVAVYLMRQYQKAK